MSIVNTQIVAVIIAEGAKLIGQYYRNRPITLRQPSPLKVVETRASGGAGEEPLELEVGSPAPAEKAAYGVSDAETIAYQDRELGKALLLMELHLQQKCKINGVPCDCCEKHPMAIEALAEEALGMTGDSQYSDITAWARRVTPMTTTAASTSGEYDELYPQLAQEARVFRKHLMGTEDIKALISPKERARITDETISSLKEMNDDKS